MASSAACGVREKDERIFYVDAAYPPRSAPIPNPFVLMDGFRACSQSEIDATDCSAIPSVPSAGTVHFEITNQLSTPVWIMRQGSGCSAFHIDSLPRGTALRLESATDCTFFSCLPSSIETFHDVLMARVEAGESLTIVWDGREVFSASGLLACGDSSTVCTRARFAPAPAGRYLAGFVVVREPFESELMTRYQLQCGDAATCRIRGGYGTRPRCSAIDPSAPIATVEFDLPADGDTVVPLSID